MSILAILGTRHLLVVFRVGMVEVVVEEATEVVEVVMRILEVVHKVDIKVVAGVLRLVLCLPRATSRQLVLVVVVTKVVVIGLLGKVAKF